MILGFIFLFQNEAPVFVIIHFFTGMISAESVVTVDGSRKLKDDFCFIYCYVITLAHKSQAFFICNFFIYAFLCAGNTEYFNSFGKRKNFVFRLTFLKP